MDDDEALMLAREVVIRYHAHGFRTRVEEDAVFVWGRGGWEGPLASQRSGPRRPTRSPGSRPTPEWPPSQRWPGRPNGSDAGGGVGPKSGVGSGPTRHVLIKGCLRSVLSKAGWDEERAELYAGVATSLHDRGELFRETLD